MLNEQGNPVGFQAPQAAVLIAKQLTEDLSNPGGYQAVVNRRLPRHLKQLVRPTQVRISSPTKAYSELTVIAADRPGLLARIGQLFAELSIEVLSARITTLGERVEDVFTIRVPNGNAIVDRERIYLLENTLRQRLDSLA